MDAIDAILDAGDEQRGRIRSAASVSRSNLLGEVGVELRKSFEIALWMARGDAAGVLCGVGGARAVAAEHDRRLAVLREAEIVGIFLLPFEAGFVAIDAQAKIVFVARSDLTGPQHSASTAGEAKEHVDVVVETAAGNENGNVGGDLFATKPADKAGEIVSMRADVAKAAGRSALRWVGAPDGLLLPGGFDGSGEPILGVFDLYDANRADFASGDHFLRLTNHGIARVVVRKAKDEAGALDDLGESHGVCNGGGERLIADDVNAGFEEGFCGSEMHVI